MKPVHNKDKGKKVESRGKGISDKFPLKFSLITKLSVVLVVLSSLLYANTIKNGYVMDDVTMISENHYVKQGLAGIPLIFETTHMAGFGTNLISGDYRPLSLVMFALEYQFFGLNPAAGHFFNILVFAACVVLLFQFLNKLFNGQKVVVAFVATLLFAVHPVHTEVVANIKSRDELLCFFFAFLSLILFINYVKKGRLYQLIAGTFCLFLSIISKETVITFLAIAPLVFFFYQNENKKRSVIITISTALVTVLFFVLWAYVQSRNEIQETLGAKLVHSSSVSAPGAASKLAPKLLILGNHLRLMLVPYPLNFNYSFSSFASAGFGNVAVLVSLAAYLILGYIGLRRLIKNNKDYWAFGILFYLVTLSLYSNIAYVLGQAMANRYEFFPSVGFCIVFALAFERWILSSHSDEIEKLKSTKSLAVLIPVLLCFSIITVARNTDWKDNYTLVYADLPKSPDDYMMQHKAGLELQNKIDNEPDSSKRMVINEESIKHYARSLEINPNYTEANSDIGVAYLRKKNYDSAEYYFKRTLELNPRQFNAATNLGTLFFMKQQCNDAIVYYQKAVRIDSGIVLAWYNMSICFARNQQWDSSLICLKKIIEIAPGLDNNKSFGKVAILYKMTGKMDSAKKYEQITKKYYPDFHL